MFNLSFSSLEKSSSVIDDAVYQSMQVPSFKYKQPHFDVYLERSPKVKIVGESQNEKDIKKRLYEKSNSPAPTTYKMAESYESTQSVRTSVLKINKDTKIPKFTGK